MTQVAIARGLFFPDPLLTISAGTTATMDAATEKYAMIGRVYFDNRPTTAKTLSTGTIQFRTGGSTFANATTKLRIGIQDVGTGAGPIAQPDGTFDVSVELTGGAGISANAWNTATMNSGSKSITHGDLIAIVWDMTARGGTDSVTVTPCNAALGASGNGVTNAYVSSAWQTTVTLGAGQAPNVVIVTDDGTLGTIGPAYPFTTQTSEQFSNSVNPDERGMQFQVPWDCKIGGFWFEGGSTDASADHTFTLWSSPTSSPGSLATLSVLAEQGGTVAGDRWFSFELPTELSLTKNTDYAITLRATGTTNSRIFTRTLGNTAHRALIPNGTTLAKVTRDGGSGNFAAESPAITIYAMGVTISSVDDGAGSGAGGGGNSVFGGLGGVIV